MDFSFSIEGLERIEKASKKVQAEISNEMRKALYASALRVEKEAKTSIQAGGKTGRIYKRRGVEHKASAPGEAPATNTGRLVNSITSHFNSLSQSKMESFVVAGRGLVKYARMLEYGTAKMAARPFFFPAFEKSRNWIQERLNKAVRDGVIKSSRK